MILSFKQFVTEGKTIFDYLLFPPEGEELKIATKIAKMRNDRRYVYRGMSKKEWNTLKSKGEVVSLGKGNTRDIQGSYVASDIQLAGRFALRNWKDGIGGVLVTLEIDKLPKLQKADPGNFWVEKIPYNAVKDKYIL